MVGMMGIHHCLYSEYLRLFHSFYHLSSSVQSYKEALVFSSFGHL